MKTLTTAYGNHVATRSTTTAHGIKIVREDGAIYAFTSSDRDDPVDGITYSATQGLMVSSLITQSGLAVDNSELTTLHDGTLFTTADVLGGRWRNAAFDIFRYNTQDLAGGTEPLLSGTFGVVKIRKNEVVVELRGLQQYLQQPIGSHSSPQCRARLGDDRCTKDLTTFTHNGTISSVTSTRVFRDSSRAEAADYFGEGKITWLTGSNAGLSAKVRDYAADGTFTLALPMPSVVAVGDTYTAIAGCRKRLEDDCLTKFDNVLNFQGEPHRRGVNDLTKGAVVDV